MKTRIIAAATVLFTAALPAASSAWADWTYRPTEAEANKYSVEQAADFVRRGFANCLEKNGSKVQVMPDVVIDTWGNNIRFFQFRELRDIETTFTESSGGFLTREVPATVTIAVKGHFLTNGKEYPSVHDKCPQLAEDWTKVFADALLRLKLEYDKANDPEILAKFKEEAVRYLAMDPKPQIPEDARRFRVQAEVAVQQKRFLEAADKYARAIEIAPWWPEAHFNRGVVLAETQNFDSAISEMKRYLILRPDAPDARQAQDFIYAWEAHPFERK